MTMVDKNDMQRNDPANLGAAKVYGVTGGLAYASSTGVRDG